MNAYLLYSIHSKNPDPNTMEKKWQVTAGTPDAAVSLHLLIDNLVNSTLSAANHHQTNVINEVEQEIALGAAMHRTITVIKDILHTVIANSRHGDIHITANRFKEVVILEIQERNNYNGYALAFSIGSIEPDAASVGGHITIQGQQQKVATISFSFPSYLLAA